jgi:hypothetical protein
MATNGKNIYLFAENANIFLPTAGLRDGARRSEAGRSAAWRYPAAGAHRRKPENSLEFSLLKYYYVTSYRRKTSVYFM